MENSSNTPNMESTIATNPEATAEQQALLFVEKNAEILEMIATGQSASSIYDAIALMYEARHPGLRCSLLELKDNKLMHGGAPSLPQEYCDAVNGLENGPSVGSCGTSTYTGKQVLVENIETDPKWAKIKHVALPHGMRCCWSEPIKDSKGKVLGAFGMYYNHPALPDKNELTDLGSAGKLAGIIMERDQRERELRQSEFKYRTLVENLPQRFFLKDKNSAFISCCNDFASDLGISAEQIINTSSHDYYAEDIAERYKQADQRIMQTGSTEEFEETRMVDGSERIIHTVKTPSLNENGEIDGVLGISWDITEQRLLEEKYQQAQKMESVGTLVGGVAHEFNNTLAGITGNVFLAKSALGESSAAHRHLDKISTLGFRAADMIKQLLTFSRKTPVQMKAFNLSAFVKETYKLHRISISENIKLETNFSPDAMPILGDTTQIQQIIVNLLHNARDALAGISQPKICLSLSLFEADNTFKKAHPDLSGQLFAHLHVEDNGCGIDENDKTKIFEPFFTTKEVGKGTGLGLAMVYGAVQTHKGIIEVDSTPGKGTNIHIFLPISSSQNHEVAEQNDQLSHGAGESILFVDDQDELRELGKDILESLGYKVLLASNGIEAVETYMANENKISLVIMDVVMPEMGGVDAAVKIRAINNKAKVIFCTGYDGKDVLDHSVLQWAKVLPKPYTIDTFSQHIKESISA